MDCKVMINGQFTKAVFADKYWFVWGPGTCTYFEDKDSRGTRSVRMRNVDDCIVEINQRSKVPIAELRDAYVAANDLALAEIAAAKAALAEIAAAKAALEQAVAEPVIEDAPDAEEIKE